jgi:uncharacterized membrane protein
MNGSSRQHRIALTGLFAALAFVLGRLPHPVNVECVTFIVFVSGYVGGTLVGSACGAILTILQLIFGGGGELILASAQLVGWMTTGAVGSLFSSKVPRPGVLGLVGLALTAFYEILTNLALMPSTGLTLEQLVAGGAGFAFVHLLNNVLVFEAGRFLLLVLERHPAFVLMRRSTAVPGH